jgi:signal transduction histidine kinase
MRSLAAISRASPATPPDGVDASRPLVVGASGVLVGAALAVMLARSPEIDHAQAAGIRTAAATITALGATGVFVLSRAIWRQVGDRAALWAGCGALVIGMAAACRPELAGVVLGAAGPDDEWLTSVGAAGLVVAPLLFGAGLVPRLRRLPVSAASLTAGAMAAVAALALVVHAFPRLETAASVSQLTGGDGVGDLAGGTVVMGVWLALAVAYTARGLNRQWLYTWPGLMLFAVTLSGIGAGAAGPANAWAVGGVLLEALGVLLAVVGSQVELVRAYEDQSLQLLDSALEAETAEVRERVRASALSARRHDLVNAIMAIDGAAMILEREFDRLTPDDRERLASVVGSGTARLRGLLAQERASEAPVSLARTAALVADDPAWPMPPKVDVGPDLLAIGSAAETAEAVRQLVDFASRRSLAGPLTLRGERDGRWAVLRVEDDGPTMARDVRRTLVDPDGRRQPGRDDAMSVQVAARLMRGQGGDLWVEPLPGGGTSFGICLPALAAADADASGTDA